MWIRQVLRVVGWLGLLMMTAALVAAFRYADWAVAGAMIAMMSGLLAWKCFALAAPRER